MTFLKLNAVSKQGENGFILKDISFSQKKFEKVVVAGETGSGKSTLLKTISGLVQPDKGEVYFEDVRVQGPEERLVPGHPKISYLSQQFELQKFLRVEQVLGYSNSLSDADANSLFKICQIDHLLMRKTDQLSGGERQRIALANLLISSPTLLLLDEPFTHLDMVHKNTLKSVIEDICRKLRITCILVSHDPADTLSWADKIIVLNNGEMIQKGDPQKIYHTPANEYVAGLFGRYNLMSVTDLEEIFRIRLNGKAKRNIIIRPGDFLINHKKKGIRGKVSVVNFFGTHHELTVAVGKHHTFIVSTDRPDIAEGSAVTISLPGRSVVSLI